MYVKAIYNVLGESDLTVSDMNLNDQIDWNDTDRIVSNDTRYVSLEGDWWRESSTWQTRQNGSPELTLMGFWDQAPKRWLKIEVNRGFRWR